MTSTACSPTEWEPWPSLPLTDGDRSVRLALSELAAGRPVLLTGAEGRHGDLLAAADRMTPQLMAMIVRHSSGFVCVALDEARADHLELPAQTPRNDNRRGTAFGVTVDAAAGVGTGISAADRSATVRLLAAPQTTAEDFTRPGHIVILRAVSGGLLERAGHTEAGLELMRMAGLTPAAVLADLVVDDTVVDFSPVTEAASTCEPRLSLLRSDRGAPRNPAVIAFAHEHRVHCVSLTDVLAYREERRQLVIRAATARIATATGEFTAVAYRSTLDDSVEHVAFVAGDLAEAAERTGRADVDPTRRGQPIPVYVHQESLIAELIRPVAAASLAVSDLAELLAVVAQQRHGVVIHLRADASEGRGLVSSLQRISAAEHGASALPAEPVDTRHARVVQQILEDLGVRRPVLR